MVKLKHERLKRGWSQVDLAYRAKIQPTEISRFETGRARPYPKQAERLARALALKPHELLEWVE